MSRGRAGGLRGGVLAAALVLGLALVADGVAKRPPPPTPSPTAVPPPSDGMPSPSPAGHGVVSGRVTIAALTLELELSQRAARAGQPVQARATLVNHTARALTSISVSLAGHLAGIVVRPGDQRDIRRLGGGDSETVSWVVCGRAPGTYAFTARASVRGVTMASEPRLLTITTGGQC